MIDEMIAIAMHLGHQPYSEICAWSFDELVVNNRRIVDFVKKYKTGGV